MLMTKKNQNCTQSYQKHLSAPLVLLPLLHPAHPATFVKSGPARWDQDLSKKEYRQKMGSVWNGMEWKILILCGNAPPACNGQSSRSTSSTLLPQ